MPEFGLCIAAMNSVVLSRDSPLFDLLFRAKVLNGHQEHGETDSEGVLALHVVNEYGVQSLSLMKLHQFRGLDYVIQDLHRSFHLLLAGHVIMLHLGLHDGVLFQHLLVLEVSLEIAAID